MEILTFVSLWCREDCAVLPLDLLDAPLDPVDVVSDLLHLGELWFCSSMFSLGLKAQMNGF